MRIVYADQDKIEYTLSIELLYPSCRERPGVRVDRTFASIGWWRLHEGDGGRREG